MTGPRAMVVALFPGEERPAEAAGESYSKLECALLQGALKARRAQMAIDADPKIIKFPEARRVIREEIEIRPKTALDLVLEDMAKDIQRQVDEIIAAEQGGL